MRQRTFLFIHGYTGSGPNHWQRWLASRLTSLGESVCFPDLPEPDAPVLDAWLDALTTAMAPLSAREVVVLAHSCGVILWLHHAVRRDQRAPPASRVLLVAPPSPEWSDPNIKGFCFPALGPDNILSAAHSTRLVAADDDPFCLSDAVNFYERALSTPCDVISGGKHLNTASGYGPWPSVEAWALTGKAPVVGN